MYYIYIHMYIYIPVDALGCELYASRSIEGRSNGSGGVLLSLVLIFSRVVGNISTQLAMHSSLIVVKISSIAPNIYIYIHIYIYINMYTYMHIYVWI
jgi:hypothetical protein